MSSLLELVWRISGLSRAKNRNRAAEVSLAFLGLAGWIFG
jgi:hypothetical protein